MNKNKLIISLLLLTGILFLVKFYASSKAEESPLPIEKETIKEFSEDSIKFVSQLQEPWNFATKKVYDDFLDQNALQSSNFDTDSLFVAQVIRIFQRENIREVLSKLDKYQNLEAISFVECKLTNTQFKEMLDVLKSKKHFKKLMVSHSNIKLIPNNIHELKNLETLSLSHSKLIEINPNIGNLKNLKYLGLRNNRSLLKLNEEIGQLNKLELLDISTCSIDSIPNTIGNCLNLKVLKANAGKLEYVPKSIGNCQELINLNLGYNQISNLPSEIGKLKNLGMLSVGHNPYDSIPVSYRNLNKLFNFN